MGPGYLIVYLLSVSQKEYGNEYSFINKSVDDNADNNEQKADDEHGSEKEQDSDKGNNACRNDIKDLDYALDPKIFELYKIMNFFEKRT